MMTNNEEIEVEAPQNLAFNIDEEMPADGEEDADIIDEREIANDGLQNNNMKSPLQKIFFCSLPSLPYLL